MADGQIPDAAELKQLERQLKAAKKDEKKRKKAEKKRLKIQKKTRKKALKRERKARKLAKKLGQEYRPPEQQPVIETEPGEPTPGSDIQWVRKSSKSMDQVEREIDRIFDQRGTEIQKRWKEKYGEEFEIPKEAIIQRPELDRLGRGPTVAEPGAGPLESAPAQAGKAGRFKLGRGKKAPTAKAAPAGEGEIFPIYLFKIPLKGLWLYQKFGVKQPNKIVSIIVLLISLILWFPLIIPRLLITILLIIVAKVRGTEAPSMT